MASNRRDKRKRTNSPGAKVVDDEILLLEDEDDNYYSSRVRKNLAQKDCLFPPGVIPLVEIDSDKQSGNSSSESLIASLSDSDDSDFGKTRPKKPKINNVEDSPVQEIESTATLRNDSINMSDFWEDSPSLSRETLKEKSRPAILSITLDDDSDSNLCEHLNVSVDQDRIDVEEQEQDLQRIFTVKIRFRGTIHRIELKKTDFFRVLFDKLAQISDVDSGSISILHKEIPINQFDTLIKVPLTVSDILEAYVLQSGASCASNQTDQNIIQLKIQTRDRKDVTVISLHKTDTMLVLMEKYANLKKVALSSLKFLFDGELLGSDETPDSLELEGDECIDVFHV